jgi:hypothetical protein
MALTFEFLMGGLMKQLSRVGENAPVLWLLSISALDRAILYLG